MRTFTEHPIEAYGIGAGPFFKSPDESAFIVWFRHLLIAENGSDLELLARVPAGWLEPGKRITVEGAATWFGPIDLRVESELDPPRISVELVGPRRNPPGVIRLHLRTPQRVRAVTVSGQEVSTFDADKGIITLGGDVDRADVVVSY